jgi:hypothetical protein
MPAGANPAPPAANLAALKEKVTLDLDGNAPLVEFLSDLSKKYKVKFMIQEERFKEEGDPNIMVKRVGKATFKDVQLGKVLADVLKPLGATYEVVKGTITIKPAATGVPQG